MVLNDPRINLSNRTKLKNKYQILITSMVILLILLTTSLEVYHLLILAIIYSIYNGDRRFFRDWGPFLFFLWVYDMMRKVADNLKHINTKPIYMVEKKMFAWMFNGQIPAEWAQNHQYLVLDLYFGLMYVLHPIAPLILGFTIYYISDDRDTFKEFSAALLLTCYAALITFALYPVAPPWYVESQGFQQPDQLTGISESAGGLIAIDKLTGSNFFGNFYSEFNSNPFAALPSLHTAFSFFVLYYAVHRYRYIGKKIYLVSLYPLSVWAAAVYLNHHYIVDIIAGILYSYVSIRTVRYLRNKEFTGEKFRRFLQYLNPTNWNIIPPRIPIEEVSGLVTTIDPVKLLTMQGTSEENENKTIEYQKEK